LPLAGARFQIPSGAATLAGERWEGDGIAVVLAGAAHLPSLEQPAELAGAIETRMATQ
jgi:pimeloyl-ACP methyl ester carboxylesterase